VEIVDRALDKYIAERLRKGGIEPTGVRAITLAHLAKVSRHQMSTFLQVHRQAQRRGKTRYVLGAEGYGRAGYWKILSKPGSDPVVVRNARKTHAVWIATDAQKRVMSDLLCELYPGLRGTILDSEIEDAADLMEDQMKLVLRRVDKKLKKNGVKVKVTT
jgi:hypothetical protein